jgi:hypothetical protein
LFPKSDWEKIKEREKRKAKERKKEKREMYQNKKKKYSALLGATRRHPQNLSSA